VAGGVVGENAAEHAVSTQVVTLTLWVDPVLVVVGGVMRRCRVGVIYTSG
jgi:hypothetical protein